MSICGQVVGKEAVKAQKLPSQLVDKLSFEFFWMHKGSSYSQELCRAHSGALDTLCQLRLAHMSENVYERHEDVMMDAAGDVANRTTDQFFFHFVRSWATTWSQLFSQKAYTFKNGAENMVGLCMGLSPDCHQ